MNVRHHYISQVYELTLVYELSLVYELTLCLFLAHLHHCATVCLVIFPAVSLSMCPSPFSAALPLCYYKFLSTICTHCLRVSSASFSLPFPPRRSCLLLGCAWQIFSITFDYHCQLCVCIYVDRSRDPFVLICIGIYSICTCICICICIGICICITHSPPIPQALH